MMVFKDAISKKFIWWHFIERKEILADYKLGFEWCLNNGYIIKAVVADGLKGLAKTFTPFQISIYKEPSKQSLLKAKEYSRTRITRTKQKTNYTK
nr:hypothetical protein [uncultured Campylobacter sp.]